MRRVSHSPGTAGSSVAPVARLCKNVQIAMIPKTSGEY